MGLTITVGGMIGLGKSTTANIISEELNLPLYEEPIDSHILKEFYMASPEEQEDKRYSFLLQLDFLAKRYEILQEAALENQVCVIDRSLYEDYHFARVNKEMGSIRELEFEAYLGVFNAMMREYNESDSKNPILMVFLTGSFETVLERIKKRGREMELDEGLYDYYYKLWNEYEDWVDNYYQGSHVYKINVDEYDIVGNEKHKNKIMKEIKELVNNTVTDEYMI